MKTIARTATRKIAAIVATITAVKVYDQATGNFEPSTIDAAFTALRANKNARLVDMENGTYNVNVHSNWWYVLTTTALAEDVSAATTTTGTCGQRWVAEIGLCYRCGKDAAAHSEANSRPVSADARAEAHPYRPAVGEWVVGRSATAREAGADVIGMFQGIKRSWMGDGFDYADLEDFGGTVLAADPDSLRPAPQVPDASHLIGRKIAAELTAGLRGDSRTGVVARVLRPSVDGGYVVVQFETGWIVRVPVGFVEETAPKPATPSRVREMAAERSTDADGVERWNVGVRLQPEPVMVNLTVTRPEAEPSPYVAVGATRDERHVFVVHDTRYGLDAPDRVVRRASGARAAWSTFEGASEAADALWAQEVTGERESGDRIRP